MRFRTRFSSVVDQVEASTTGLICASPVGLLIPFLVEAVLVVDNVLRSSSPIRDKCDSGGHIARQCRGFIASLYEPQACELVIPIGYVMLVLW